MSTFANTAEGFEVRFERLERLGVSAEQVLLGREATSRYVERLTHKLQELSPTPYGRATAEQLVSLARQSVSSGLAIAARSTGLRILCDQLEHTLVNLANLEKEMDQLISKDPNTKGLQSVPEFGARDRGGAASRTGGGRSL